MHGIRLRRVLLHACLQPATRGRQDRGIDRKWQFRRLVITVADGHNDVQLTGAVQVSRMYFRALV